MTPSVGPLRSRWPRRRSSHPSAGEAAGVTLTALVTIAGIGVAVSGTVLEVLQHQHFTTAAGIERILLVIAALLLPAGLAALWKARDGVANFTGKD